MLQKMRNGLVIARQVFEDPLGRAVCSKGSQIRGMLVKARRGDSKYGTLGALRSSLRSTNYGGHHGLWQRRLALVDRNPASDHSSFGFVHAPLITGDVDQLSNGSEETLRAICASGGE